MSDLEKIAKVRELGGDIRKLEKEVSNLDSKKTALINDLGEMKKTVNKSILDDRKSISKEREVFGSQTASTNNELSERDKELSKRETQIEKKEGELVDLKDKISKHNKDVLDFKNKEKGLEETKKSCLEKEHKANLIIKQFENKIKELNK